MRAGSTKASVAETVMCSWDDACPGGTLIGSKWRYYQQ